jgi:hypothetical protein
MIRIAHLAHDTARDENGSVTLCGEPWQNWQAPGSGPLTNQEILEIAPNDYRGRVELREERAQLLRELESPVRQCQGCLAAALLWAHAQRHG